MYDSMIPARRAWALSRRAPGLLIVVMSACSRPSASNDNQQREAYARAVATLTTDHPGSLPEFARAVGARPAECELGRATCECTWRFITAEGVKEIAANASFVDARTSEPETVSMSGRDGSPLDLPPDDAERGYRSGEYNAPTNGRVPVSTAGGEIVTVASEELTEFLNTGGHLVSRRALKAAELEKKYASWTELQRLDACTSQPGSVWRVKLDGHINSW